jgi:hypothetical protein
MCLLNNSRRKRREKEEKNEISCKYIGDSVTASLNATFPN